MSDHDDIIILKEQMKVALEQQEKVIDALGTVSDDLKTFKGLITTGKWIFGAVLLTLGALGHKSADWITKLFYGS